MGGPPLIAYLYSKPWELDKIKSIMAIAFLVTSLIRVPFAGFTTDQLPEFIILTVVCILPICGFPHPEWKKCIKMVTFPEKATSVKTKERCSIDNLSPLQIRPLRCRNFPPLRWTSI